MLKPVQLFDPDTRVKCFIENWIALDDQTPLPLKPGDTPIRLRRSKGRRRPGRLPKYWIHGTGAPQTSCIEAATDEDAIKMANAFLGIPPERPEFSIYYDAQGREHGEF